MLTSSSVIAALILKYFNGELLPLESEKLSNWRQQNDQNEALFQELIHPNSLFQLSKHKEELQERLWNRINYSLERGQEEGQNPSIFSYKVWFLALKVAAVFILLAGAFWLYFDRLPGKDGKSIVSPTIVYGDTISLRAVPILTLANGDRIPLGDTSEGLIAAESDFQVFRKNGLVRYQNLNPDKDRVPNEFNTVSTPAGSQYRLLLSDGSQVWLNANSSIKIPPSFGADNRSVQITGEVFFQIDAKRDKPFYVDIVEKGDLPAIRVKVLGTSFNVKAYAEESVIRTTLITGALEVYSTANRSLSEKRIVIKPDQQAIIYTSGKVKVEEIGTHAAVAWKEGVFQFREAPVAEIMNEISRWYNVEIIYKGNIPDLLVTGDASRKIELDKLLNIIALSGVNCALRDHKVIVYGN
ncbi:MAG: DUF4974 domain-containing protein [Candidatus Pseudobacter hemicellulosilyticus]|uniref:DUF4974 domain-containing protein n=1 Tax=Candidatus Pseudobacter hemicellulosilyticus TaxID=3121375 RepID=A0AAJ5WXB1_9BACT|nr:MAG: DUF4974 domain-containing protein [Pseudobacter sp.]